MTMSPTVAATVALPDRRRAAELAGQELSALIAMARQFTPEQWAAPTACTEWTVRDMIAHLTGALEEAVRPSVNVKHQTLAALGTRRDKGARAWVDYTTQAQVNRRHGRTPAQLLAELERLTPRFGRARARWPEFLRRIAIPREGGLRRGADLAYLMDVIYARDVWLHRVDLARATGIQAPNTEAESSVVEQVIRDLDLEWTGPPVELELVGHAGGRWVLGTGEPVARVREDTVAFMRLLSGRSDECALDVSGRASVADRLRAARVVF